MAAPIERWGECFFDHYQRYFRDPVERRVFRQSELEPSIQVLRYRGVFAGCEVFATLGLSHYPDAVGAVGELIFVVDEPVTDAAAILSNVAFYLVQNAKALRRGTSVAGIDAVFPQFSAKYGKTGVYLALPFAFPPEFSSVTCDSEAGHIYLALLIAEQEFEFISTRGSSAFETLLEESALDPFALHRPALQTRVSPN